MKGKLSVIKKLICIFIIFQSQLFAEKKTAIFAGGCFWCMEADFEKLNGVTDVSSGFSGGIEANPTYRGNHEGHYEVVRVTYDSKKLNYKELLDYYWIHIDPFDSEGQFCDKGPTYKTAIFVSNSEERKIAQESKKGIENRFPGQSIATAILDTTDFFPMKGNEEYHQDYYKKNPVRYKLYRWNCGRDQRLNQIWNH
ncbi:MAG: peptide-methionine (S)-S-oxide reductase MsrA [Halobacteriovoraceae bacterium]|nr:peptide-methionine (S)-S-oxide reductase MsrA [Halobacteriovoraceae bacterium]